MYDMAWKKLFVQLTVQEIKESAEQQQFAYHTKKILS